MIEEMKNRDLKQNFGSEQWASDDRRGKPTAFGMSTFWSREVAATYYDRQYGIDAPS